VPIAFTDISGKPATYPPTVPIAWTDVSGKPSTYPPTLPIAQADVTGLPAAQTAQDNAIATKLNASAYTAADVLAKMLTMDGAGSTLDADLLDGQNGTYYLDNANTTGILPAASFNDTTHGNRAGGALRRRHHVGKRLHISTDKSKLDGASGATAYVHPSGDGNLHVPATALAPTAWCSRLGRQLAPGLGPR
jgi:hypothetical protein